MNKANIYIRKSIGKDYELLANLGKKTFIQTYRDKLKEKDILSYVKKSFNKDVLLKEIKNPSFIFLIVLKNGKAAGYAKLLNSKKPSSLMKKNAIEIVRLYVLKKYQGQKIGRELLKKCINVAKKNKFEVIWIGVWEKNYNAIDFYKKSGFKLFGQCKFNFETEIHNDLLMKKIIN